MAEDTQSQVLMKDVVIPEENVLTRGGDAFKRQLNALNWERLGGAVMATSSALCAFDKALEYAQDREQFDQPIADFQGIEWKLADMATELQAARHLTFRAAINAVKRGQIPDPMETMMVKLYAAQVADRVVDEALQIHGANGYQQGHDLEYLRRLVRGFRIAGGTDEIQKNAIAKFVKRQGLPHLGRS
jgi:alkylation response protein AidB-like acyl-CoA dehydrogenase